MEIMTLAQRKAAKKSTVISSGETALVESKNQSSTFPNVTVEEMIKTSTTPPMKIEAQPKEENLIQSFARGAGATAEKSASNLSAQES